MRQVSDEKSTVALSNWRAGRTKPGATEIALLAEMAGLPVFETLAEIDRELNADNRSVWDSALGNLHAAGAVMGVTTCVACTALQGAQAAEHKMVRPAGIEPATPAFGGQYSIH